LKEKSSSEGRSPEGADGGDARMESDAEEDLWQRKDGEADAGSVGKRVWRSGMDGRDKRRAGEKNSAGRRRLRFNGNRWGGGARRVDTTWRQSGRARRRERGPWARRGAARQRGRDAVDVADRWAEARRGPGHQRLGATR
jgi:hypothetical protein